MKINVLPGETSAQVDVKIHKLAADLSMTWYRIQSANNYAALYLYYADGDVRVSEDSGGPFVLASAQRISPGWSIEQVREWIYQTLRTTPFLPV